MDMWVTKPQLRIIKTMRLLTLHLAPLRVPIISAFTRIWHFWSVKNRSINFKWCTFYFMNNSVLADAETIALNKCLIIWWTSYCQCYELFNINTLVFLYESRGGKSDIQSSHWDKVVVCYCTYWPANRVANRRGPLPKLMGNPLPEFLLRYGRALISPLCVGLDKKELGVPVRSCALFYELLSFFLFFVFVFCCCCFFLQWNVLSLRRRVAFFSG